MRVSSLYYGVHISIVSTKIVEYEMYRADSLEMRIPNSFTFEGVFVKRDPLPSDDVVDFPLLERLNENRTLIRKYPEIFLSIVGLSRSFIDDDVHPTFLGRDKKEMSLLNFVKSVDPFKVKIGERTLAENKHPLSRETEDMVISPSRKTLNLVDHAIVDELQIVVAESYYCRQDSCCSGKAYYLERSVECWVRIHYWCYGGFAFSFVTLTLDHEYEDESTDNVRTRLASDRYKVLTSSCEPANTDMSTFLRVNSHVSYVHTEVEATTADPTHETGASSVVGHEAGTPSSTLGEAYEHEIMIRERFEKKFVKSVETIQKRDVKVMSLKSRLEKAEGQATEVIRLRGRVYELEAAIARANELADIGDKNAEFFGGTGITVIYQVMQTILKDPEDDTKMYVVYANWTEDDILLRNELDAWAEKYQDRVKVSIREGWKYSEGRSFGLWTASHDSICHQPQS
ncbi:gypsy type transposase [Tanacetum coccineum]